MKYYSLQHVYNNSPKKEIGSFWNLNEAQRAFNQAMIDNFYDENIENASEYIEGYLYISGSEEDRLTLEFHELPNLINNTNNKTIYLGELIQSLLNRYSIVGDIPVLIETELGFRSYDGDIRLLSLSPSDNDFGIDEGWDHDSKNLNNNQKTLVLVVE